MPTISNIYFTEHKSKNAFYLPVILLHGAGSNHLCWPAEIRRLKNFHTIALDLPGHGKSPGTGFHNLKSYTNILLDFFREAGWYRVFLVGHSMGGAIALQFTLDHPEHVIGMSLLSTSASFSLKKEIVESFRSSKTSALGREQIIQMVAPMKGQTTWFSSLKKSFKESRDSLLYADYRACNLFDIRADIKEIHVPTQIIAPTNDTIVSYSSSSFLAKKILGAELVTCYQNGHMVMLEDPQFVSQELLSFLTRNKPIV